MDYTKLKKEFDAAKARRSNFDNMYQVIGEYVAMNRQDFTGEPSNGEFLVDRIFDATGAAAAKIASSALLGMLWPGSAGNSFELAPVGDDDEVNEEEKTFFIKLNKQVYAAFDDPRANLAASLDAYMYDQIVFGTSGVGTEDGEKSDLFFSPYSVKEIYPITGKGGVVIGFWVHFQWSVERIVGEYGLENCGKVIQDAYKGGKTDEMFPILFCVKKRDKQEAEKGQKAMPYQGHHLSYKDCHLLKEDGFWELPIAVGRWTKLSYEEMGRSPAMDALPDIREANVLREALIVATEKILDMPKGVMSDGDFGGGTMDFSAGAINVFNSNGTMTGNPVFDIGSPPNIPWAEKRLEQLRESISQHFNIDRLLDLNNSTEMTLGEAQIRDQAKVASLSALFNRQIQVLQQVIERGVSLLFRSGKLGVVRGSDEEATLVREGGTPKYLPDSIAKKLAEGKDIYKVNYKTRAALAYSAEQYRAMLEVQGFAASQAQINPNYVKRINEKKFLDELCRIRGISFMLKTDEEYEATQAAEQQQMQQQQGLAAGEQLATIAEKAANAEARVKGQ
ncbi:Head-to-tail connector protein, podovirus-type [uncultured Caudovirales phage]|uniref:Head-to-tail connector protein, podovirus-type n=1 Tax=uncultured Caudovirales phage TaxID=2100421 RepID=A0A6J5LYR2_9CAUD|nr:Head-to-tail connector protein, podovirus-type [uncultured Caudovirales phage]